MRIGSLGALFLYLVEVVESALPMDLSIVGLATPLSEFSFDWKGRAPSAALVHGFLSLPLVWLLLAAARLDLGFLV